MCLGVRRVIGFGNYEVIAKLNEAINEEFEITSKLTSTITDDGSNFFKAFKMFGSKEQLPQKTTDSTNLSSHHQPSQDPSQPSVPSSATSSRSGSNKVKSLYSLYTS